MMYQRQTIGLIMPALNEAQALPAVLTSLPRWLDQVVVVANGSTDRSADIAAEHGAVVVGEPRRGYGAACLAGLTYLASTAPPDIVVFMDADGSDDPADLPALLQPLLNGNAEMTIGVRARARPGSLTRPRPFGKWPATGFIRLFWGTPCADLGPFRAIGFNHLKALAMDALGYGWTLQMQARAASCNYRTVEVPVADRKHVGQSKESCNVRGVIGAGTKILSVIAQERFGPSSLDRRRNRIIVFSRLPKPGTTKTRMIPALGPDGAAELQRKMTRRTLQTVDRTCTHVSCHAEVRFAGGDGTEMAESFGPRRYAAQGDGDLGARLQRAFEDAFRDGVRHALCVGSDCPSLNDQLLREAFEHLRDHDIVIGPALDGGYYLIGLTQSRPELFEGITWGSDQVLADTLAKAEAMGLDIHHLPTLQDVDVPADLEHWYRIREQTPSDCQPLLSVIIPTLNEEHTLARAIESAKQGKDIEVIISDGGSTDATLRIASDLGARIVCGEPGRGRQLARGAEAAEGDNLLFLHADTRLPFGYREQLGKILDDPSCIAGAFRMAFDHTGLSLRLIEWGTWLRSRILQMPYGDQGLFLRKEDYQRLGGFRPMKRMEDFDLLLRLRRKGTINTSKLPTLTSARRYRKYGPLRTVIKHQQMILSYFLSRKDQANSHQCPTIGSRTSG